MLFVSSVLFFDFLLNKRLYIFYDIGGDTRQSYWPMYKYVIESIRDGSIRSWSFQIGLGTSTFTLYSFIFDPFIIILLLFPVKYLTYGILVSSIVKIFISGILFYFFINLHSIKRFPAVIASLVWAFNGYMMLWGQHYWFATMIVLFTFVMFSLECWLRGRRSYLFPVSIAIMGINSPYFLFMISLFIFFYVLFHFLFTEEKFIFKELFFRVVRFFIAYFIGLGASAVVFLPVSYLLLSSPRTSGAYFSGKVFYLDTLNEYITIFMRLFSNNTLGVGSHYFGTLNYYEGPMLSTSVLFILALPQLLFVKTKLKNKVGLILAIVICLILLIDPFFTTLFSAFSAFTFRWNFLLVFLNVVTIGYVLHYFSKEKRVTYIGLLISSLIVVIGWYFCYKKMIFLGMLPLTFLQSHYLQDIAKWLGAFLAIYAIIFILLHKNNKLIWLLLLCLVSAEIIKFNYPTVNERLTVPVDDSVKKQGYYDFTNEAVSYIKSKDQDLYRIDKNYKSYSNNDSLFQNFNGVKSYNSLNHPSYINFFKELNTGVKGNNLVSGFDQRSILRDLTGVKYVLSKDEKVPSGYKKLKKFGDVQLFENPYALPIGFTYDSYITETEFNKLMPFEKDAAMLHAGVVNKTLNLKKYTNPAGENSDSINIKSFTINYGKIENIKNHKNSTDFDIITTSNDPNLTIQLPKKDFGWKIEFEIQSPKHTNGQIFWARRNESFEPNNSYTFEVFKTPIKVAYELNIKNMNQIRFDPGQLPGTYRIKNFKIVPNNSSVQKQLIHKLSSDKVQLQEITNSYLKGIVSVDKEKLLFFSIPYDKGWTLMVDGNKVRTERVNMGFTGAVIPKGKHIVELEYNQPLLLVGSIISIICWAIIICQMLYCRKKLRIKEKPVAS